MDMHLLSLPVPADGWQQSQHAEYESLFYLLWLVIKASCSEFFNHVSINLSVLVELFSVQPQICVQE
jgi:hypothetical protein